MRLYWILSSLVIILWTANPRYLLSLVPTAGNWDELTLRLVLDTTRGFRNYKQDKVTGAVFRCKRISGHLNYERICVNVMCHASLSTQINVLLAGCGSDALVSGLSEWLSFRSPHEHLQNTSVLSENEVSITCWSSVINFIDTTKRESHCLHAVCRVSTGSVRYGCGLSDRP
jgi:hypothetical protein